MKKSKYILIVMTFLSTIAYGQMSGGAQLGLLTPMGQNSGGPQFGLNIMGRYEINDQMNIGANIGYYQKSNNATILGTTFKSAVFSLPVTLTAEYFFSNNDFRPYASADLGLFVLGARFSGESSSSSFLTLAPGVGGRYAINRDLSLDISLKYHLVFINNNTSGFLATNVGVLYAF